MTSKRNDQERKLWVDNDEGLYLWKKSTRLSMCQFIRENRDEIDAAIDLALNLTAR